MGKRPNTIIYPISYSWIYILKNLFLHNQFDSKYVSKPVKIMKTVPSFQKQVIVDTTGIKGTDE